MEDWTLTSHNVIDFGWQTAVLLVILGLGYIAGSVARWLTIALCDKLGLRDAALRGGVVHFLQSVGIEKSASQVMGSIVFWLLMATFLMFGLNLLGMEAVGANVGRLVEFIPRVMVAAIVVVVGLFLATLLRGAVVSSSQRADVPGGQHLGTACYYITVVMVLIAAFEQLQIKLSLVNHAFLIAFAALALAVGLAAGLGGRDVMAGILAGYYVRHRLQAGERVAVAGLDGTIREVGSVATIIETEEQGLLTRHSVPNVRMLNEAVR